MLKLFKRSSLKTVELNEYGQPIGEVAATLSSFLGLIARNGQLAPLDYKDWRLVPSTLKNTMWMVVLVYIDYFFYEDVILFYNITIDIYKCLFFHTD